MTARLFLAQRLSGAVLAITVALHLAGILAASREHLSAAEVLQRTRGNSILPVVYGIFVVAAAVHAPIGLRNIIREWTAWRGRSLDLALAGWAVVLLMLGLRAVYGLYRA
jgi:fumarate reductase subunit C